MSVAKDEAREEYWNEFGLQSVMLRTAYVEGRTAEPCERQIEAVAKTLAVIYAYSYPESDYYDWASIDKAMNEDEDHWSYLDGARRDDLMKIAKRLLDTGRKAVM